jgi:hypothetical protein
VAAVPIASQKKTIKKNKTTHLTMRKPHVLLNTKGTSLHGQTIFSHLLDEN